MKLKRFNPDNSKKTKTGKSTIRFAKQGQISLSKALSQTLGLSSGDCIELVQDEDSPEKRDWYIVKSDTGFKLRRYKEEEQLCFNCAVIAKTMIDNYAKSKPSVGFLVAKEPEVIDGDEYYAILASSAY